MSEFDNIYEQSVSIAAIATQVERCFTDQQLMHQWLNPALACEPVGEWSTAEGSEFDFKLKVPILSPLVSENSYLPLPSIPTLVSFSVVVVAVAVVFVARHFLLSRSDSHSHPFSLDTHASRQTNNLDNHV